MNRIEFSLSNASNIIRYLNLPNACPMCKSNIAPRVLYAIRNAELYKTMDESNGVAAFGCTACYHPFVGDIVKDGAKEIWSVTKTYPTYPESDEFEPVICAMSLQFVKIYHQAQAAEAYGLDELAGIGFRKALEFLIKDYCIKKNPTMAESICTSLLRQCIDKYIPHERIKATAKAASWIGNDETHYMRKWVDKDISDLKRFLKSCYHWIVADLHTDEAIDMTTP